MPTKEEIKKEIDKMPDDLVNTVYQYIKEKEKQKEKTKNRNIKTYSLKGKYDNMNIRDKAYE